MRTTISVMAPPNLFLGLIDKAFEYQFGGELLGLPNVGMNPQEALIHRILQWSTAIQRIKKVPVSREYRLLSAPKNGQPTHLCMSYVDPAATRHVVSTLCQRLPYLHAANKSQTRLRAHLKQFDEDVSKLLTQFAEKGQNRTFLIQIARDKGVPIDMSHREHPVFGTGRHALRMESTLTRLDSALGLRIARNKHATGHVLRKAGLPGAENMRVSTLEQAKHAAEQLGYPVVIKPEDQDGGKGVYADIRSEKTLAWAYEKSRSVSANLLIEKHFDGLGHRISMFGDLVLSANRKIPAGITADGTHSVRELIEIERAKREDTRDAQSAYRLPLTLDEEAQTILEDRGIDADTILPEGEFVPLRRKNNSISGGETEAVELEEIHQDNLELCRSAALCLDLELIGIDLLIPDISVSWKTSGALICELNGIPQIGYLAAEKLISTLFVEKEKTSIHCLLADDPADVAWKDLLALGGELRCDVVSDMTHLHIDGKTNPRKFPSFFDAARTAVFHPKASSVLFLMPFSEVMKKGFPSGRLDKIFVISSPSLENEQSRSIKKLLNDVKPNCSEIINLQPKPDLEMTSNE